MGPEDARHLLNRTGFDAQLDEIDEFAALSRREAVERVLARARTAARTPLPEGITQWVHPRRVRQLGEEERRMFQRELIERGLALKAWWLTEMLTTDSPLAERMTLFWHNHFTSSLQKVRSAALMHRQNALLRRHALGSFAELLHAAARDPAMLVYLDSAANRRGQPNENFAREVMELFTLGEGRYGEHDVKEAARAFTGWSLDPETGEYLWRPFLHDDGEKTVLGRTGNWRGENVLDVLLAQPATAEFVVAKLWREFVSPQPDVAEVKRIGDSFRSSGYSIRTAIRELLMTDAFWSPANRAALIKSPVELVVGTMRQFDIDFSDPMPFVFLLRNLGQDLLQPPNVKGWPGGERWINSSSLLARKQFLERVFRVEETRLAQPAMMQRMEGRPMAQRFLRGMADLGFSARDWFRPFRGRKSMIPVVLLPAAPAGAAAGTGIDLLRSLVADPVYQLK